MLTIDSEWIWDFWLADDGTEYHLFYLHAPRSLGHSSRRHRNARIGHAVSSDLRDWTVLAPVLGPGGGFDATATWTGSTVLGDDGLWRMFYTGSRFLHPEPEHANIESVGVAVSSDLSAWTKRPGPVVEADERWYERLGSSTWPEEAWRDPWVFRDPRGEGWHMLLTARADSGADDDRGVIGHAVSDDLESWTVRPPLSSTEAGFAHLEVPQTVQIDGRWMLLFSAPTSALSLQRQSDDEPGGVWALEIADPAAPFDVAAAQLVVGAPYYAGKAVQDRDGRWMLLAFIDAPDGYDFPGVITDPMPLRFDASGRLAVEASIGVDPI